MSFRNFKLPMAVENVSLNCLIHGFTAPGLVLYDCSDKLRCNYFLDCPKRLALVVFSTEMVDKGDDGSNLNEDQRCIEEPWVNDCEVLTLGYEDDLQCRKNECAFVHPLFGFKHY
jgi:hypothetical protein